MKPAFSSKQMKTLTIRIPSQLQKALMSIGKKENKTVSELIRDYAQKTVAIESFRMVRSRMVRHAEKQGIVTDEDVFRVLGCK